MLGLTKREITERFDEIVEFAELESFIDAPVKTYSSGMYMRLGFAVAIHVDPDLLLVDEVLAVGDEGFTHKCLDKFAEFRRRGKTILLVTHSLGVVERFCDEALWLDDGRVRAHGDPRRVVDAYLTAVEEGEEHLLADDDRARRWPRQPSRREAPTPTSAESIRNRAGRGAAADRRRRAEDGDEVQDMFRPPRAGGAPARSRSLQVELHRSRRAAVVRVPLRRSDVGPSAGSRPRAGRRLRVRHQPVQRRRRLLLRHQHLSSRR